MSWLSRFFTEDPEKRLLRKYLAAVKQEFPLWFNPRLNSVHPRDRFFLDLASFTEDFRSRQVFTKSFQREQKVADRETILQTYDHLLNTWPGGLLAYNGWYVLGTARELGLLDEDFAPIYGRQKISEEKRQIEKLAEIGGAEAIAAYNRVMNS